MEFYGFFLGESFGWMVAATVFATVSLGFFGAPLFLWSLFGLACLYGYAAPMSVLGTFAGVALLFNIKPLRRILVSAPMMKVIHMLGLLPQISATEKAALNAGAVWVDADFFSGKPNFSKLLKEAYPALTKEEQDYIDGPIEELCRMTNDWKISQNKEIPKEVWAYMKKIKIFGMIIQKKYGGLEFSAAAHSAVIMKLSSRSVAVTVTAMVPNSLGPAELLTHFGTEEQKNHYLPRLAAGDEIPCFALTEQRAGSDAGSLESNGELFKKDGKLYIRLNWNKRWITLAGVSTVLGLAFELRDPEKLLGNQLILGITCALIPSKTKGVVLGRRHDPLGVPFYNCPTQGQNVEIPVEWIIGGIKNAGKGWTMLMESLGAGRGISLPSQAAGSAKLVARVTSAHSSIRKQFGTALCKLEGLEEPLARIGGFTYLLEAMRVFTVGALDRGIKPSVITAIAKYNATELGRKVINDGMDIMAGAGISRGPRNLLSTVYQATPIGITVEGANILTRTLIVFGQGLMRAHPWAFKEVDALETRNLPAFDQAIWGHAGHVIRAVFRTIVLSLTRGHAAGFSVGGPLRRYAQKLAWVSASFALFSDVAMLTLGASLKKKEKLTGRFADILSWQYMCTAVMRRYLADGQKREDLPLVDFALRYGLTQIQEGFDGIFANLKVPGLSWFFSKVLRTWNRMNNLEWNFSDDLGHKAAVAMLTPGAGRDRLTNGIHIPKSGDEHFAQLESALDIIKRAEEIERRISAAVRKGLLPKKRVFKLIGPAREKGIITAAEDKVLQDAAMARWEVCHVDSFTEEGYHGVEGSDNKVFRENYVGPGGAPQHYDYKKAS